MNDEVLTRFLKVNYYGVFLCAFVFGLFTQLQIVIQFHGEDSFAALPVKTFFGTETNFPIASMKFLKRLNKKSHL
jgi:hypothetical protein